MPNSQKFAQPETQAPRRWTPYRKLALIDQITWGKLTKAKAIALHGLSKEELDAWLEHYDRYGLSGLKATRRFKVTASTSARQYIQ